MNKEIIKAMNKKETAIDRFGKWWNKNGYKVMRVVLFPIWGCICAKNKIENYLNSKCEWSEERANEILSYYIPRKAKWHEDEKCFYLQTTEWVGECLTIRSSSSSVTVDGGIAIVASGVARLELT